MSLPDGRIAWLCFPPAVVTDAGPEPRPGEALWPGDACGSSTTGSAYASIRAFSADLSEAGARDLAGHPDVAYVEQDLVVTLDLL